MSSFAGATLIVHAYRDVANEDLRRICMSILVLGSRPIPEKASNQPKARTGTMKEATGGRW